MIKQGNLLRNCMLFGRMLRALGLKILPTQIVDWVESLQYVEIGARQDFKNSARTILINRQEHLVLFDEAFDLFWQARSEEDLAAIDLGKLLRRRQPQKQQVVYRTSSNGSDNEPTAEPQLDRIYTYNDQELLRQKDFAQLDAAELAAIRRMMARTVWQLEPRRTRRTRRTRRGGSGARRRGLGHPDTPRPASGPPLPRRGRRAPPALRPPRPHALPLGARRAAA